MAKEMITMAKEMMANVTNNKKPNTEGYVNKVMLADFIKEATGEVVSAKKTRDFLVSVLDKFIQDSAIVTEDPADNDDFDEKESVRKYEAEMDELERIQDEIDEIRETDEWVRQRAAEEGVDEGVIRQCLYDMECEKFQREKEAEAQENNSVSVTEPVQEEVSESAEVVTEETTEPEIDKWSVNYWWTPGAATHVLKKCVKHAATNNKRDFISHHMVRSIVLEMMFGKQLVEYVDKKKVVNFSKEGTPREWQLAADFCNRFFKRYLHTYKGGCVINSEAMCWAYKKASYAITVKGYRVIYDLDWDTKSMRRRDNGATYNLTNETFAKLDETCGFIR